MANGGAKGVMQAQPMMQTNKFARQGTNNPSLFSDPNLGQAGQDVPPMPGGGIPDNVPLPPYNGNGNPPYNGNGNPQPNTVPPNGATTQGQRAPSIFSSSAQGINDAMAGARNEMNYSPMGIQSQGYNAAQAGAKGVTGARTFGRGYNAQNANSYGVSGRMLGGGPSVSARDVNADRIVDANIGRYMNPYNDEVVNRTLGDLDEARRLQMGQAGANATASGAFGGSRHALRESENNSNFFDQAARTAAGLRQQGFNTAQGMAQQDIANKMQSDLANQGASLQADTTTANIAQQRDLADQSTDLRSQEFSAAAKNQAEFANQAARNQAGQFGAQAFNTANLANQASRNQANQFSASAGNTARLANQAANNRANEFNIGQNQAAQMANQAAGLAGSQQRLSSSNQLGNLANLGFGMGQTLSGNLAQDGAMKQGINQLLIDAVKNQFNQRSQAPYQSIGLLSQALGASPVPQTTTTSKQPGLFDYLTLGASMSDMRLKTNINPVGNLPNGLGIYTWDWTDEAVEKGLANNMHVGVLAQEVEKIMPSAIVHTDSGYMAVKYNEILQGF